jgi:hypothetical protein
MYQENNAGFNPTDRTTCTFHPSRDHGRLPRTCPSFSLIEVEVFLVDLPIQANASAIVRVTFCMVGTLSTAGLAYVEEENEELCAESRGVHTLVTLSRPGTDETVMRPQLACF